MSFPQAYYKGYHLRGTGRWPAIEAWFAALEQRPTYLGTRSDYFTHAHDLPPQLGGASCIGAAVLCLHILVCLDLVVRTAVAVDAAAVFSHCACYMLLMHNYFCSPCIAS